MGVITPELEAAAERLRVGGHRRVLVRGAPRLPVWFATGAALRHARGFDVAALQHGDVWVSDTAVGQAPRPEIARHDINKGSELAVGIGVAVDPTEGVRRFISDRELPVGRLTVLTPPGGPGPEARLAVGLRDAIRALLEEVAAERDPLVPRRLALLLGHRWNALRPTIVYEHLGPGAGYMATMTVAA